VPPLMEPPATDRKVVAVVAAHDEAEGIGDTVSALATIVGDVVVVDDGSTDGTASLALVFGASVLRASRRRGKGRALEEAFARLPEPHVWLLADGDVGATAAELSPLVRAVSTGQADLAIAAFPKLAGGGFGLVKGAARRAIRAVCGFEAREPLSGQRALTPAVLAAARPLAPGFGVEVGMTIDAVRAGFRVVEIPIDGLSHRPTGRGARGFAHRARQGLDVLAAVVARAVPRARRPSPR
jgi:glucosyl-3-phosphoglycerate synthase